MNSLHWIVRASHCRSTQQYFAVDALPLIQTDAGKRLATLLLRHYRCYLRGAIDPDVRIRDFQNQVIHVEDGFWGGAPRVAHQWYNRLQRYLHDRRFAKAAHAAGVLCHYFTDPIQPLHTAYSDAEAVIHQPLEWSIQRDYQSIYEQWLTDDMRVVFQLSDGPGWLGAAMIHSAKFAHRRFHALVNSYRLDAVTCTQNELDPAAGLDPPMRLMIAETFGLAITGWARVLERVAQDTEAITRQPLPTAWQLVPISAAAACVPIRYWRNRVRACIEDQQIKDLIDEYRATGTLTDNLPAEVDIKRRVIRVYRGEQQYRQRRSQREQQSSVIHPPQIAPELLSPNRISIDALAIDVDDYKVLQTAGIHHLDDLISLNADSFSQRLSTYWITAPKIKRWQRQATLMSQMPSLDAVSAQMLAGADFGDAKQIAESSEHLISKRIADFMATTEGRRCTRGMQAPSNQLLLSWMQLARSAVGGLADVA